MERPFISQDQAGLQELFTKLSQRQAMLSQHVDVKPSEQTASGGVRIVSHGSDKENQAHHANPISEMDKQPQVVSELTQLREQLEMAQNKIAQMERESLKIADTTANAMYQTQPALQQSSSNEQSTPVLGAPVVTWDGVPLSSNGVFFHPLRSQFPPIRGQHSTWPSFHTEMSVKPPLTFDAVNHPTFDRIQDWSNNVLTSGDPNVVSRPPSSLGFATQGRRAGLFTPDLASASQPSAGAQFGHAYSSAEQHGPRQNLDSSIRGGRLAESRLSPTATEFSAGPTAGFSVPPESWAMQFQASHEPQQSYLSNAEPLNYRRLLEKNMSCNWKYVVDKIVCNNDQQASIFLQQKLKIGTSDQKKEIVTAIIDQAYPLMVNRFGNFLVQRCFEHGSPEQIILIARAIRGNTLNLSMDAFGCHVVQKAFDSVPEEYKAIMVHELLRRIPETVIHRYACHVWQKLFELRWTGSPPQIMKYVNEALHGMWHEVALGETGSLVVQNIFENCLEQDKRPCVNEVLASIDVVAHGQFGNWCIQHICEHGSIPDRTRATEHVLRFATEYSMDQFASKVVEKCLKIGGADFLDRYLDRVCEACSDRPRMPLIDIAGDQFGNYLIQYVLTHADPQRREVVASHIRKHMVSLRGSKYGSRVAMLCCNPAYSTRPGPPTGIPMPTGRGHPTGTWSNSERLNARDRSYGGSSGNSWWS